MFKTPILFYHTYLILTGQTTWEEIQHAQIDYLRAYNSDSFLPWNFGPLKNLQLFFFRPNIPV